MESKLCTKCLVVKHKSMFGTRISMGGSYLRTRCNECEVVLRKERRARNKEEYNQYQKKYYSDYSKEKRKAHALLNYAIKNNKLIKNNNCEKCNKVCITIGHHEDYSEPLDVKWLCRSCHYLEHKGKPISLVS